MVSPGRSGSNFALPHSAQPSSRGAYISRPYFEVRFSVSVGVPVSKSLPIAMWVTVILLSVSVPVLSQQITVALPSVSTAGRLFTSAFFFAIR